MKKVVTILMAAIVAMSLSLSVFAAGGFMGSPSGKPAPEIVDSKIDDEDCDADVVITPYSERDDLDDSDEKDMEDAYKSIVDNTDVTKLSEELKKIAEDKDIPGTNLAVSELFHIDLTDCEDHDEHGYYDLTLASDLLEDFVALMWFDGEEWHVIPDAKVAGNGDHLMFTMAAAAPYAIVVDSGKDQTQSPITGENGALAIAVVVMLTSAAAALVFFKKSRKAAK